MSNYKSRNARAVAETLSPLERKILPLLKLSVREIKESTGLDDTSLLRALKLLESKGIIKLELKKVKVVELGT
ncbi:hypothetical protein D6817_04125, partial [Candidatus Pacearchaeota archaeon]